MRLYIKSHGIVFNISNLDNSTDAIIYGPIVQGSKKKVKHVKRNKIIV